MLPLRSGKRVVDHARAEPDEAETYGAVANEAAKLIPQECGERTRIGSRGGMVNRISSKSTVVYAIGSIPLSIYLRERSTQALCALSALHYRPSRVFSIIS